MSALGQEDFLLSRQFLLFVLLRSLTDVFAEWFKMSSFSMGDLSVMVCLQSLSPVFLLFTSPWITGDPITANGVVGVLLVAVATVFFVYDPNRRTPTVSRKAIVFALLSAFFFSLNTCFDRLAVQIATPLWSAFAMNLLAALFLLPLYLRSKGGSRELRAEIKLFSLRGLIETFFMITKLWALQFLQAPYVAALQRVSILITVINGRVFLDEPFFARRIFAALLMLAGVIVILLS